MEQHNDRAGWGSGVSRREVSDVSRAVAEIVVDKMHAAEQNVPRVSRTTGISTSTLRRRLAGQSPFLIWELAAVATALNLSVVELVPAA